MKNLVAKLEVIGVRPDGERIELRAEIGRPREERDRRWACEIAVAPLKAKIDDVRGTDSFHAVWLAARSCSSCWRTSRPRAGRLENRDGSAFPLDAYRSGLDPGAAVVLAARRQRATA